MARFQLTQGFYINHKKLKAGTLLCNGTACNAGDEIWTGLNSTTYSPGMNPLDAAAITIKNASRFANAQTPVPDGVNSIDG